MTLATAATLWYMLCVIVAPFSVDQKSFLPTYHTGAAAGPQRLTPRSPLPSSGASVLPPASFEFGPQYSGGALQLP